MLMTERLTELAAGVGGLLCFPFYRSRSGSMTLPTRQAVALSGGVPIKSINEKQEAWLLSAFHRCVSTPALAT